MPLFGVPGLVEPRRVEPTEAEARGVTGPTRLGQCIVMAVDYAHAHPEEAIVVYGSILLEGTRGQFSIDHAWCELRGGTVIYDGVQGAFYDASSYRRQLRATECFRWRPQDYDGPILSLRGEREC